MVTKSRVQFLALLILLVSLSSVGCGPKLPSIPKRGGGGSPMDDAMMIKIGFEIIKKLLPLVTDTFNNSNYIDPTWVVQYESPNYYWDPRTNLYLRGNRVGGVNYWTQSGGLVGFSAYHGPTSRYAYFDGFGHRIQ